MDNTTKYTYVNIDLDKLDITLTIPLNTVLNKEQILEEIKIQIIIVEHIITEYQISQKYFFKELNDDYYIEKSRKLDAKAREIYKNTGKLFKQIHLICKEACSNNTLNETMSFIKVEYNNNADDWFKNLFEESYNYAIKESLSQKIWEYSNAKSLQINNRAVLATENRNKFLYHLKQMINPYDRKETPNFFNFAEAAITLAKNNEKWDRQFYTPFLNYYRQYIRDKEQGSCYGIVRYDRQTLYMSTKGRCKNILRPKSYTEIEIEDLLRQIFRIQTGEV